MKEFGSDFHYIAPTGVSNTLQDFFPSANYYADGRQALIDLYRSQGWQRFWVPEYFCYDVIESLKEAGLELVFYTDYPDYHDDSKTIEAIQRKGHFRPTDAILRVNYFGMRSYCSTDKLMVPVVEDHTHDLISGWAINSHADWCIASLRKSLPIPEGGMLWSPVGLELPMAPAVSEENEKIAATRWEAMRLKARYLAGEEVEKVAFRAGFVDTEEYFDRADVCALDVESQKFLQLFDIRDWYKRKWENWELLRDIKKDGVRVLRPENRGCCPFSLILVFTTGEERDRVRKALIEKQIYPAILWNVPEVTEGEVFKMSRGILSIHCDARYTKEDILQMKSIIESTL
ncbi:MAG: hypothetical protein J6O51_03740 [Bacteroidales bacterium]|nr:hypothetical protein [Bacteroidales bacterium]